MRKYRYTSFNCIRNYYNKSSEHNYNSLILEEGYSTRVPVDCQKAGRPILYCRKWDADKIAKLEKQGYIHNFNATESTGGDNDFIVIDHLKKEYCFWENGFYPFCGYYRNFPQDEDLEYHSYCRR